MQIFYKFSSCQLLHSHTCYVVFLHNTFVKKNVVQEGSQYLHSLLLRRHPSAGDRTDVQLVVREIPHGDDMVAPVVVAPLGTCRPSGAHPPVVHCRRACRPSHSAAPRFSRRALDEDDRPQWRGSTVEGRQLSRVAAASPYISCRTGI